MKITTVTLLKCPCDVFIRHSSRYRDWNKQPGWRFFLSAFCVLPNSFFYGFINGWSWTVNPNKEILAQPFCNCCILCCAILLSLRGSHKYCKYCETHHHAKMETRTSQERVVSAPCSEYLFPFFSLWYVFLKFSYVSRVIYPSERQPSTQRGRDGKTERERQTYRQTDRQRWGALLTQHFDFPS